MDRLDKGSFPAKITMLVPKADGKGALILTGTPDAPSSVIDGATGETLVNKGQFVGNTAVAANIGGEEK